MNVYNSFIHNSPTQKQPKYSPVYEGINKLGHTGLKEYVPVVQGKGLSYETTWISLKVFWYVKKRHTIDKTFQKAKLQQMKQSQQLPAAGWEGGIHCPEHEGSFQSAGMSVSLLGWQSSFIFVTTLQASHSTWVNFTVVKFLLIQTDLKFNYRRMCNHTLQRHSENYEVHFPELGKVF